MWTSGEGLEEDRVLPDVKLECIDGPAAEGLYTVVRPALTSKEGRTAGAKKMATEKGRKKTMKAREEPGASGNTVLRGEPKIGGIASWGSVPASEILCEDCDGVNGGQGEGGDDDQVSLKKAVSFMRRERIAEIARRKGGGVTQDALPCRTPYHHCRPTRQANGEQRTHSRRGQGRGGHHATGTGR